MCCMRLAGNTGCKNNAKNCHLRTIAQLCRPVSSQLRHVSTIGKKLVKQQYVLHMSSQYGKLWLTNGWDRFGSLGHPSKFQHLAFVTAATSLTGGQPNFARCLAVSCAGTLYTVSQKTSHLWLAITLTHEWILTFFGRNITDKVGNQRTLHYATSNNLCFCTTTKNGKTRKSHFSLECCISQERCSSWTVLHAQCYLSERKNVICNVIASNIILLRE